MVYYVLDGLAAIASAIWLYLFSQELWPTIYKPAWMLICDSWKQRFKRLRRSKA